MFELVDFVVVAILISGGMAGAKNGFFKQSVVLFGTILCFLLAWGLKDSLANFMSYNLPFFKFAGLTSFNIIMYQLVSFILILSILGIGLTVLIRFSGILEKILNITIILGIPSKILGFIVGVIEAFIIVFVVFFFIKQPYFDQTVFKESTLAPIIVDSSPVLSNVVSDMNEALKDCYKITKDYEDNKDIDKTNKDIVDSLVKHKIITKNYVDKLQKKGKINY